MSSADDSSDNGEVDNSDESILAAVLQSIGMIALVNGMQVYNDSKLDAIDEYDGNTVEWVTHPELSFSGVCDYCDMMDGEQFSIDDAPSLPDDAHVNCSCEMAYVSDDDTGDLYNMDDFQPYLAWRDSSKKALDRLFKGVMFAQSQTNITQRN